jgi:DNA-binding beta-propeller fold protein YncE
VPWGNKIAAGVTPGVARWTPDGRHLVVTNLYWDEDVEDSWGRADNQSTIMVYRFDAGEDPRPVPVRRFRDTPRERGPVHHARVANVAVGAAAENLVVSPDGRWIVTLNMETSFLPTASPAYAPQSSLSLLEWDAATENLVKRATVPFEGVLPEGITFDRSGRYLAVANFDHHHAARPGGSVDLWELVPGPQPTLVKLNTTIDVPRGAHVVEVIP